MATHTHQSPELLAYAREISLRDDPVLADLRELNAQLPGGPSLQVMAEEGQLLSLLVRLTDAARVLEIGTFTGYSTLCMARALSPGGQVVTCELNPKWIEIAASYWDRAGVSDRIDARVGDAHDTLAGLHEEHGEGGFDLAFVDADKAHYPEYYETCLHLVRPGGLIVLDNTLFFGRVADPAATDPDTCAVRDLNKLLRDDERVELSLLVMADGITLVRKKSA
ncbi:class I SAM-dependent methyltransferase [Streptomyces sp. TG1A-8]|uniref:O-methyltransferase n=1 Tax=Streptomyces sp. TG1A-8 TaxID=3051385 RepID=UPI00265C7056|nr:class I SAM-dependent methyltransferase [Streptomyces sp. TG1A-8]MDO0929809.1 class I SAM-dependent methyltransferase [Streptomyces sp. TG1A-8]